ncbi:MAG: hypothetical protein WAM53_16895, partial [Terrimicrobiaceae bacterium]
MLAFTLEVLRTFSGGRQDCAKELEDGEIGARDGRKWLGRFQNLYAAGPWDIRVKSVLSGLTRLTQWLK